MTTWKILTGDVREKLAEIPSGSVQCVVTEVRMPLDNFGIAIAASVILLVFFSAWLFTREHIYLRCCGLGLFALTWAAYGRFLGLSWFSWFPLPVQ